VSKEFANPFVGSIIMHIDVLTLFPGMFDSVIGESMLKRARQKGLLRINVHDLRDWTSDNHRTADDKPFGGGPGMVMKVEPVYRALKELQAVRGFTSSRVRVMSHRRTAKDNSRTHEHANSRTKVILLTPQGKRLDQGMVRRLSKEKSLTLICGHYEGFDERIRHLVDEEISIGDYVLTCGEIPALVIIDAVARLLPGGAWRRRVACDGVVRARPFRVPALYQAGGIRRHEGTGDIAVGGP